MPHSSNVFMTQQSVMRPISVSESKGPPIWKGLGLEIGGGQGRITPPLNKFCYRDATKIYFFKVNDWR